MNGGSSSCPTTFRLGPTANCGDHDPCQQRNAQRSTLNPQPATLTPKPLTSKPLTLNPQPSTLNPQPVA
eukprot:2613891-Rhodomonas_salina.3